MNAIIKAKTRRLQRSVCQILRDRDYYGPRDPDQSYPVWCLIDFKTSRTPLDKLGGACYNRKAEILRQLVRLAA